MVSIPSPPYFLKSFTIWSVPGVFLFLRFLFLRLATQPFTLFPCEKLFTTVLNHVLPFLMRLRSPLPRALIDILLDFCVERFVGCGRQTKRFPAAVP